MTETTLYDYTDVEPLKVREAVPVNVNGSVLAWAGPSNREQNVVVSQRHRHKYDGGKQDYYRKYNGYCYGENALDVMESMGATRIVVHEVDNDRLLEFDVNQFRDSDLIADTFEIGGKNRCVPIDDAIYSWERDNCTIVKDHQ
jgi:hypothetical protein